MSEEAAKVRDLRSWPRWPWLPVKRRGDAGLETGTVYADDIDLPGDPLARGPIRVFDVNVFDVSMAAAVALTSGESCPWPLHGTYASVEAMLADGWVGD